jgi:hypothetical protein
LKTSYCYPALDSLFILYAGAFFSDYCTVEDGLPQNKKNLSPTPGGRDIRDIQQETEEQRPTETKRPRAREQRPTLTNKTNRQEQASTNTSNTNKNQEPVQPISQHNNYQQPTSTISTTTIANISQYLQHLPSPTDSSTINHYHQQQPTTRTNQPTTTDLREPTINPDQQQREASTNYPQPTNTNTDLLSQ